MKVGYSRENQTIHFHLFAVLPPCLLLRMQENHVLWPYLSGKKLLRKGGRKSIRHGFLLRHILRRRKSNKNRLFSPGIAKECHGSPFEGWIDPIWKRQHLRHLFSKFKFLRSSSPRPPPAFGGLYQILCQHRSKNFGRILSNHHTSKWTKAHSPLPCSKRISIRPVRNRFFLPRLFQWWGLKYLQTLRRNLLTFLT